MRVLRLGGRVVSILIHLPKLQIFVGIESPGFAVGRRRTHLLVHWTAPEASKTYHAPQPMLASKRIAARLRDRLAKRKLGVGDLLTKAAPA